MSHRFEDLVHRTGWMFVDPDGGASAASAEFCNPANAGRTLSQGRELRPWKQQLRIDKQLLELGLRG